MPRLVAIDLGSHSVKATVFNGAPRRYQLEERYSVPVRQDGSAPPTVEARLAALDALLAEHRDWASGTTWGFTWPGEQASLHRLHLPFKDRAQIEQTLPFTVEEHVPFDMEDMVFGWRATDAAEGTDCLVGLVRRDALRGLLSALSERRIDPRYVFVDADVVGALAPRERTVAVIDVGHAHTVAAVCKDGVVHWSRSINVGGRDFTQAIARSLGQSWHHAETTKHGDPTASPAAVWAALPDPAKEALDGPMGLLLAEVRSSLISAEDALGVDIEEVRLCGGGARLHPIRGFLYDDLRVPVEWATLDDQPLPPEHAEADGLGLGMAGMSRGVEIDLRVGEFAFRGGTDVMKAVFMYGVPTLAFCLMTATVLSVWTYIDLMGEQAEIDQRVKDLVTTVLPEVNPSLVRDGTTAKNILSEAADDAKARASALDRSDQVPPTADKMLALTNAFPKPDEVVVDVSELTITPDAITFTAETDGYSSSAKVEEALQAEERFNGAAKGNEKKVRDKVQFTVSIPLGANSVDGEEG